MQLNLKGENKVDCLMALYRVYFSSQSKGCFPTVAEHQWLILRILHVPPWSGFNTCARVPYRGESENSPYFATTHLLFVFCSENYSRKKQLGFCL